jgi:phosphopantetheinyl transferase
MAKTLISLGDDEIHRAERFHFERDQRLLVASRALARRTLSRYVNVEPAA